MLLKIIILLIIIGIILLIDGIFECKRYKITKYKLSNNLFNPELKVIMFADLHNVIYKNNNKKIIEDIRKINPNIILIPGDLLVFRLDMIAKGEKMLEFLNKIAEIAPIYYSLGNHERNYVIPREDNYTPEEVLKFKDFWNHYKNNLNNNVHILINEKNTFEFQNKKINIFGYDLPIKYYKRMTKAVLAQDEIDFLSSQVDDDAYNILLAHNPDFFKDYAKTGFDIICSGHNHGGIMKIPFWRGVISPRLHIFPKYTHGIYELNRSKMILTNGLGIHTFKIRINNVPEIVYIKID